MIVTPHAVKYLISGTKAYNNDINAIDKDGVQYGAGQICTEDDQAMRELLVLNECKPVFEICELTWHCTYTPSIQHLQLRSWTVCRQCY
jgi:hypothetical protein